MTSILLIAVAALVAFWLLIAICFGIGLFGRRASMNAIYAKVARAFGEDFTPVGRLRWAWIAIRCIPFLLLGAAVFVTDFFIRLLVGGWCWLTGRPMPQPPTLDEVHDDAV